MNTSDLLEQLLRGAQGSASQSAGSQSGLGGLLGGLLGAGRPATGSGGGLGGLLGGILGGGATPQPSANARAGTSGPSYAVLASLGMMAFKAYQSWQQQQSSVSQTLPQTVDQLSGAQAQEHSHAILRALIAAAKADGSIDQQEERHIREEIVSHSGDDDLQQWLDSELAKPLDATEVATAAQGNPAVAAEMYLASVLLVNDQGEDERLWLDSLAAALKLDPQLQISLEAQASGQAK